uniref:Uncharacterized protein n=1 Tax=Anopheles dirus TaxID=7168 RepID=A0A182N9K5_9DIPT
MAMKAVVSTILSFQELAALQSSVMKNQCVVLAFWLSVLLGRCSCVQPGASNDPQYLVSEQSGGKVGKVEISSNVNTGSRTSFVTNVPSQRIQSVISPAQTAQNQLIRPVQAQQTSPYEQSQSQYERELAQYRKALAEYRQQSQAGQRQQLQPVYQIASLQQQQPIYQQPQYALPAVQQLQYAQYPQPAVQQTYFQQPQNPLYNFNSGFQQPPPLRPTSTYTGSGISTFDADPPNPPRPPPNEADWADACAPDPPKPPPWPPPNEFAFEFENDPEMPPSPMLNEADWAFAWLPEKPPPPTGPTG